MKNTMNKIPFYFKFWALAVLLILSCVGLFYSFHQYVLQILISLQASDTVLINFRQEYLRYFLLLGIPILLLFIVLYRQVVGPLKRLNAQLATAVAKKNMALSLDGFDAHDIVGDIAHHANLLFALIKEFDAMKSSRISMEVSSIKSLMNSVSEGVLLVNTDRIVTHINHQAETMLRLIPGEIIGQTISRNISPTKFLDELDQCLDVGRKITNLVVDMNDEDFYEFVILPIKNKQDKMVRALVVVKPYEEGPVESSDS